MILKFSQAADIIKADNADKKVEAAQVSEAKSLSTNSVGGVTPALLPEVTTTRGSEPLVLNQMEMSSSMVNVFNSVNMPSSVMSSLVPIVIGTPPAHTYTPSSTLNALVAESTLNALEEEIQKERLAIANFIKWLLSFFNAH